MGTTHMYSSKKAVNEFAVYSGNWGQQCPLRKSDKNTDMASSQLGSNVMLYVNPTPLTQVLLKKPDSA